MPKVSIIIPTHNNASFLCQAIDSALNQTYQDFEVIVVDDGSTDNTNLIIQQYKYKIQYIYQENQERSTARNKGASIATGDYFVFLDADDILLPNKLSAQASFLDNNPDIGLVAGGYQHITKDNRIIQEIHPWESGGRIDLEDLLLKGLFVIHSVMLRREWFIQVGGFDNRYTASEDVDFWLRLNLEGCKMEWEESIVCQYRIHESNFSHNLDKHYNMLYSVVNNIFEREDFPEYLNNNRNEILSEYKISESGKRYAFYHIEEAKNCLRTAIQLNKKWGGKDNALLAERIVGWQNSVWVRDRKTFLRLVFNNLPNDVILSWKSRRRIFVNSYKSGFYTGHKIKNYNSTPLLWLKIVFLEPSFIINRGGISILVKSLARNILSKLKI